MHSATGELDTPEYRRELDELFSAAYHELRRLASAVKRTDEGFTLNPTALVNEAWIKLAKSPPLNSQSTQHFKRIAARAMRQVLVEAARRRNASKRDGGAGSFPLAFDGASADAAGYCRNMLALDEALQELETLEPRQALLVEGRFFGGLDVAELAELLQVSPVTVARDWRAARAWLSHRLQTK